MFREYGHYVCYTHSLSGWLLYDDDRRHAVPQLPPEARTHSVLLANATVEQEGDGNPDVVGGSAEDPVGEVAAPAPPASAGTAVAGSDAQKRAAPVV